MTSATDLSPSATVPGIDVAALRSDFPILDRRVNDRPLIYLDSAATSQKPRQVLQAEYDFLTQSNAAVHRGAHTLAADATDLFEDARAAVAGFVGAQPEQLVWISGATMGLNLLAYAIGNATAGRGGRGRASGSPSSPATRSSPPPSSTMRTSFPGRSSPPAPARCCATSPRSTTAPSTSTPPPTLIGPRTRIVAFTHVSNVLGIINPVAQFIALAQGVGALTVMDACQSAPHLPLDLPALGVDFAVFSGHKMLGPYGVGGLYGRAELLDALPPFLTGGSMITTVTLDSAEYLPAPQRFEAGTQPVGPAIGLAAAVRYLDRVGLDAIHAHEVGARRTPSRGPHRDPRHPSAGRRGRRARASACGRSTSTACTPTTPASSSTIEASPCASAITAPHPCTAASA